jgi:beta-galactosidase
MPDIGDRIRLSFGKSSAIQGGGFLQSYALTGGTERGRFADGRVAVVEHAFGRGRTLLVGTHPGVGYFATSAAASRQFFADVFAWTGRSQHVALSNPAMQARVHGVDDKLATLWVLNPTREPQEAAVSFGGHLGNPTLSDAYWSGDGASAGGGQVTVPARDVLVLRLAP